MEVKEIVYFDKPGPQNTDDVINAVKKRLVDLGIKHVVVASNSGDTALKLWEAIKEHDVKIISVAQHAGWKEGDDISISPERRKELEEKGIYVLITSHALSGVGRSITNKFGGISHVEIIAHTFRRIGQGIKVCAEIAIMAADEALIPTDREIIAIGGSGKGADASVVMKAAHMNNFFDLEIREIIAMPKKS